MPWHSIPTSMPQPISQSPQLLFSPCPSVLASHQYVHLLHNTPTHTHTLALYQKRKQRLLIPSRGCPLSAAIKPRGELSPPLGPPTEAGRSRLLTDLPAPQPRCSREPPGPAAAGRAPRTGVYLQPSPALAHLPGPRASRAPALACHSTLLTAVSAFRELEKGWRREKEEQETEKSAGEDEGRGKERGLRAPPTNVQTLGECVPRNHHLEWGAGVQSERGPPQIMSELTASPGHQSVSGSR